MNYIGKFITNFKDFYKEINSATLTGAIDVVIVKQDDDTYLCSPFHVRFGKIGVLRSKEQIVDIEINGEPVDVFMKLGDNGEAFFVEEFSEKNDVFNIKNKIMYKKKDLKERTIIENVENFSEYNFFENDFKDDEPIIEEDLSLEEENLNLLNYPSLTRTKSIFIPTVSHEIHPYSDGEVSPFANNSPKDRSFSPKSDTEYEISKNDCKKNDDVEELSWQWGELPQISRKVSIASNKNSDLINEKNNEIIHKNNNKDELDKLNEENNERTTGVLQNVLTLLNKEEKVNKELKNLKGGIYLDELNSENLDPAVADLYFPKPRSLTPNKMYNNEIELGKDVDTKFNLLQNVNLVQKDSTNIIDTKTEKIDLLTLFKEYEDISISLCGTLKEATQELNDQKFDQFLVDFNSFVRNSISILQNPELMFRINKKYYNWQVASSILLSLLLYRREFPNEKLELLFEQQMQHKKKEPNRSWWSWRKTYPEVSNKKIFDKNDINLESVNKENQNIFTSCVEDDSSDTDIESLEKNKILKSNKKYRKIHYKKVLRLGSDDIVNLNLHEGANEVVFSITTAYQGTTRCKCHVYLWNYDDKIIISDIDGTITKSDVLGHILPILGKDWAQSGVANLFTKIRDNGYKLLYLSARAIGQAKITREYLKSVRQGELCLPDGPLLLSPTSLISAFHREVIEKKPEEFKISCLKDIQALFPSNPFYAGFGNKINDTWAYRAVGIPLSRIFTINHKGELKLELIQTFQSSYTKLTSVVDQMFPPLENKMQIDFLGEYNSFIYWRDMLPKIRTLTLDETSIKNKDASISPITKK